jgi:hypothetical protein
MAGGKPLGGIPLRRACVPDRQVRKRGILHHHQVDPLSASNRLVGAGHLQDAVESLGQMVQASRFYKVVMIALKTLSAPGAFTSAGVIPTVHQHPAAAWRLGRSVGCNSLLPTAFCKDLLVGRQGSQLA